jgi:hypothetical protein
MEVVMEMVMNKEDKIKARAYELYKSKGSNPGNDLENWLQAEKEVTQEIKQQSRGSAASVKKSPQPRSKVL